LIAFSTVFIIGDFQQFIEHFYFSMNSSPYPNFTSVPDAGREKTGRRQQGEPRPLLPFIIHMLSNICLPVSQMGSNYF
jgi:hypothetical protein